jgi:prepilin peptidase CpaA
MRPWQETEYNILEVILMNSAQFIAMLAVALAVCAAFTDVKARRIPNRLTYPAILIGLGLQGALHGWKGLLLSASGGLLFGGVLMLFHLVRAMGAGDVKLATALGCMAGLAGSPQLMFATAVAGGALAMVFIVASGRIAETLRNTLWVVAFHAQHGLRTHPTVNLDNPGTVRMPYGLAFAAGTLYWAVSTQLWR